MNDPNPIVDLGQRLAEAEAEIARLTRSKPWFRSLTVQMLVGLTALIIVVLVGEYGGWRGIALQVLHKILIDSFAAAVLVPIFASGAIFGRVRKGDLV